MMSTSNLWSATSRYIHQISPHEGAISPGESHLRASNKISKCTKLILYKYIQSTECEMSLTVENRWKQARRAGTRFLPWSLPAPSSTKTFTQTGNDVPLGRDAHIVFTFVWNVEPLVPHVWLICRWLVDGDLISLWLVSAWFSASLESCGSGYSPLVPLVVPLKWYCHSILVYTPDKKSALDLFPFGFVWKCWVYSQWNSHLIGIMISKTIGFRGLAYFQTHPLVALEDPRLMAQIHNAGDIVNSWVLWSCAHLEKRTSWSSSCSRLDLNEDYWKGETWAGLPFGFVWK